MSDKPEIAHLVPEHMPLSGIHLIEASAGTGKTYNITRIYLRLLLERKLTVQQILVMTFTKDATEEIRGRIDGFIRQVLNQWHELKRTDAYIQTIATRVSDEEAQILLKQALLYLDEAAIFTIHGFCKNVLTRFAFESSVAFNANMESDQNTLMLQATQDWYRQLAADNENEFLQLVNFWPVPLSFIKHFAKAINTRSALTLEPSQSFIDEFTQLSEQAVEDLSRQQTFLFTQLVDNKPQAEQQKRSEEFTQLIHWLQKVITDHRYLENPIPDSFIDGRRFSRAKEKSALVDIFSTVNQVKVKAKTLLSDIAKLEALKIVQQGIEQIRAKIIHEKQQANLLSFDDLITTLADQLASNSTLAKMLYQQFPVALIDEFQDTDPAQFSILKDIYYHQNDSALMMIGDPKQAIYGFRGGDVFAYMSARHDCHHQWVMDTNWRSTPQMINGYNRLFYGNALTETPKDVFGYQIPYFPVKSAKESINQNSEKASKDCALRFIHFQPNEDNKPVAQSYRSQMAVWCANEIIDLLSDKSLNIQAKDIALLVRDGTEANDIKQALFTANLPSVYLSNRANLLHSEQTKQLIQLLKGILFLENERLFSASLTCALLPFSPKEFYRLQQDDLAWQEMKITFSQLRHEWLTKGFITMALKLMHDHMVISGEDSERCLTNLLHLFELLQSASQQHKQPQELLYWFEQQSLSDSPDLETELRLESEENLIRIITQHGSKGLEYPVVFIPFASRHKDPLKFGNQNVQLIEYHNQQGDLTLSLSGSEQAKKAMSEEAYAETIRLLYVAVTRAEHRCYLLTTAFEHYHSSPLGLTCQWQKGEDIVQNLEQIVADGAGDISLTRIEELFEEHSYCADVQNESDAQVAQFNGNIERDWWLSSFTALSRNVRDYGVSTPDRDPINENVESIYASESLAENSSLNSNLNSNTCQNHQSLIRFTLTKGAKTGNFLHDIFEHVNFAQPDWTHSLHWPLLKYGELLQTEDQIALTQWLQQILITPLKPDLLTTDMSVKDSLAHENKASDSSFSLSQIPMDKTLREMEFYFPINKANTYQLSQLLLKHRKHSPYAQKGQVRQQSLSVSFHQYLQGMMHGFIDLIFEHQGKYYLGDYKSNYLGNNFEDYQSHHLQQDIETHHYDLQYLIYSLALHRYLKLSLDDYHVERDFGGVFYFYLRGMSADENFNGCGVYYRKILEDELKQLDAIFSGETLAMGDRK